MANEEHLHLLKVEGVNAWNAWREENPRVLVDLSEAELSGVDLSGANLWFVNLRKANLFETNLTGAILAEATLTEAILKEAILNVTACPRADFTRAILTDADLTIGTFIEADFTEADLSFSSLTKADLTGATLKKANLFRASLFEVEFNRTDMEGASLAEAEIRWTLFGDINLSSVKGLNTIQHKGPSTIGIDTIYRSSGNIPESFLKGAGVPDTFITFSKSLIGQAIDFYSAFISYSSKDQAFAERLYADLQNKGVRCWYAPEDLKIGERFRIGIDESIRIHDKLLLILSEHSVASDWVELEVETALEKEHEQGGIVLFPIRLDEAVMEIKTGWPALVKRTRHIGDFRQWETHDEYQKAFKRLLRDLKAESASNGK